MNRLRTRREHEHGAVAVEFALVLPVLVLLVFGMIDLARALNAELQLSQAAREAVRVVAIDSPDDPAARAEQAAPAPAFGPAGGVTTTVDSPCPDNPQPGDLARVTVHFSYDPIFLPTSIDMSQTAVMRCGG